MKKIPTMFERDWKGDPSRVINKITPGCEWTLDGSVSVPTRKMDGTCCMVRDGKLYKRREIRFSDNAPEGFEIVDRDVQAKKFFGWMPVGDGPEDRWHREAMARRTDWSDGTYELCGPKVQGNPEGFEGHWLISHGSLMVVDTPPRTFDELRAWLVGRNIEGIVWHHVDGRMAKIKMRDFGFKRTPGGEREH